MEAVVDTDREGLAVLSTEVVFDTTWSAVQEGDLEADVEALGLRDEDKVADGENSLDRLLGGDAESSGERESDMVAKKGENEALGD